MTASLRERLLSGALFLTGRSVLVIVIGLVSTVLVTRAIGPLDFGLYLMAFGVISFLANVATLGIDVYLIRRAEEPDEEVVAQAATLALVAGGLFTVAALLALPALSLWFSASDFALVYVAVLAALPLIVLAVPATAMFERALDYRRIAILNVVGKLIFGVVAIALAYAGFGVWAPVSGLLAWRVFHLGYAWWCAPFGIRLRWRRDLAGDMLGYGTGYASAQWIWQLRTLVNPLVVGGLVGAEGVAVVGLATSFVQALTFVKAAAWRLALVGMAKVQSDQVRSERLLNEAMLLQVLACGPILAAFAAVGPIAFGYVYPSEWNGVWVVYPFIAFGAMINAIFNMHSSQLYVRRKNLQMAFFHLVHVALFAVSALILVRFLGLSGYGGAEIIAMASYFLIHRMTLPYVTPKYDETLLWAAVSALPLLAPYVSWVYLPALWLPLVFVAVRERSRRRFRRYLEEAWARLRRVRPSAPVSGEVGGT